MKTLFTLVALFITFSIVAQTQIPEGGFDNWTPSPSNTYYEPSGGWWTTLNSLELLGGPVTVSPSTDMHSGTHAAKLETLEWGTLLLSGLLAAGEFITTAPFIEQGRPFTDLPSKIKGWYKYTPVNGDSAGVVAILTRFNTGTNSQDTIAEAIGAIKNAATTYTQFEFDFDYSITGTDPDTIILVFVSSGDGGNFNGQVGSTLLLDDISLEYPSGIEESIAPEFTVDVFPSPASDEVSLLFNTDNPEKLQCRIYTMDGSFITSFSLSDKKHQLNISTWKQGKYIVQAWIGNNLASSSKFMVLR
jgi:hypothetical protein